MELKDFIVKKLLATKSKEELAELLAGHIGRSADRDQWAQMQRDEEKEERRNVKTEENTQA